MTQSRMTQSRMTQSRMTQSRMTQKDIPTLVPRATNQVNRLPSGGLAVLMGYFLLSSMKSRICRSVR